MIISARAVLRPRTASMCPVRLGDACEIVLPAGRPRIRLYGRAMDGDPAYAMHVCVPCARAGLPGLKEYEGHEKLRAALESVPGGTGGGQPLIRRVYRKGNRTRTASHVDAVRAALAEDPSDG